MPERQNVDAAGCDWRNGRNRALRSFPPRDGGEANAVSAYANRRRGISTAKWGWQIPGLLALLVALAALAPSAMGQQTAGIGGMWTGKSGDDSYLVIIPGSKGTPKITLETQRKAARVVSLDVKTAEIRPDGSLVAGNPGTTEEMVMRLRNDGRLEKRRPMLGTLPGGVVIMERVATNEEWRHNERISKELRGRSAALREASGRYTIRGLADDRRLTIKMDLGPGGRWATYGGVFGTLEGEWGPDTRLRGQIHGYVETPDADGSRKLRLIADYGMVEVTRNEYWHRELSIELAFAPKKAGEPEGIFVPIVFEQMPTGGPGPTSRGTVLVQRLADVKTAASKPPAGAVPPPRQDAATIAAEPQRKSLPLRAIAAFRFPDPPDCATDFFPTRAMNKDEARRYNARAQEWVRCLNAANSSDYNAVHDLVVRIGGKFKKLEGRFESTPPPYCDCKRELEILYDQALTRTQVRSRSVTLYKMMMQNYQRQIIADGKYYPDRDTQSAIRRNLDGLRDTKPNLGQ